MVSSESCQSIGRTHHVRGLLAPRQRVLLRQVQADPATPTTPARNPLTPKGGTGTDVYAELRARAFRPIHLHSVIGLHQ